MAGRMNNRDRIERLRAEADLAAKEAAAKRVERSARPARKSSRKADTPTRGRIRLVWRVCDPRGEEVQQFPYSEEQRARDEAARLSDETGRAHFVTKVEVPVDQA